MTLENLTPEQLDATAAALQASGRFDEYLEMTEALIALYPQRADVHLHRARALGFGARRRAEALREVEVATRLVREEPQDLMRLAAVLLAFDLIEGVDEYVERAVRAAGLDSAADEPSLAYLAGVAALARGEDRAAQTLLEAAVAGDPRERDGHCRPNPRRARSAAAHPAEPRAAGRLKAPRSQGSEFGHRLAPLVGCRAVMELEVEHALGGLRFPVFELCGPAWELRGRLATFVLVDPLDRDLIGVVGLVTMEYGDAGLKQGWRRVASMARVTLGGRSVAPADRLYSDEMSDDARTRVGMGEVLGLSRLAREAIEASWHGRPSGLAYEDARAAQPEPATIEVDGVTVGARRAARDGAFAIALCVPERCRSSSSRSADSRIHLNRCVR